MPRFQRMQSIPLFRDLTAAEKMKIAAITQKRIVSAHDVLFRKGSHCRNFFVCVDAPFRLFFPHETQTEETTFYITERGDFLGEKVITSMRTRHILSAEALEDGAVFQIQGNRLKKLLHNEPSIAVKMYHHILTVIDERLALSNMKFSVLHRIAVTTQRAKDTITMTKTILESLLSAMHTRSSACVFFSLHEPKITDIITKDRGMSADSVTFHGDPFIEKIYTTRETALISPQDVFERKKEIPSYIRRSGLGAPILIGKMLFGALVLVDKHHPNGFTNHDRLVLEQAAHHMAAALHERMDEQTAEVQEEMARNYF